MRTIDLELRNKCFLELRKRFEVDAHGTIVAALLGGGANRGQERILHQPTGNSGGGCEVIGLAVQLGVRDYITKPWEPGEVEMCVNWAIKAAASESEQHHDPPMLAQSA
jgi:hypothetical protein